MKAISPIEIVGLAEMKLGADDLYVIQAWESWDSGDVDGALEMVAFGFDSQFPGKCARLADDVRAIIAARKRSF